MQSGDIFRATFCFCFLHMLTMHLFFFFSLNESNMKSIETEMGGGNEY